MTSTNLKLPRLQPWWRGLLLLTVLGGCGGGVDSGGTGATVTYSSGPVSGYGSIIVNGVRFDDSSATVTDADGAPRSKDDLKLGMVVEVRGSAVTSDGSGVAGSTASSIVIGSEIVGPIDTIASTSLIVLGRTIDVHPTTVFADGLTGGLLVLAAGDVVEIYGLYDASTDRVVATRIERKSSVPHMYRILGNVSSLDTQVKTFAIGSLQVSYSSIDPGDVPVNLGEGAIVRVRLDTSPSGQVWAANRLRDGVSRPDNGFHSKVEGLISGYSPTGFSVGGVPVTIRESTTIVGAPANGVRVEVEGTFSNGALAAATVEVESASGDLEFEFLGPLTAVSTVTQTITLQGVNIDYSAAEYNVGDASNLLVGANVKVKAILLNGTQLQASRIEFKN